MVTADRLVVFAREHEDQARVNGDELRVELWNDVIDKLLDRIVANNKALAAEFAKHAAYSIGYKG